MRTARSPFGIFLALLWVMSGTWALCSACTAESVSLQKLRVRGALTYVITADLRDPAIRIDIGIPEKGFRHSESFVQLVRRHAPVAAVTGTYFDTRTLLPVGSIVIAGETVHKNAIGTSVCFIRPSAREAAVRVPPYVVELPATKAGERCDWTGVECGIRTGPRLLAGGHYALNPRREGFTHPGLFGCHRRMALGVTSHNKLLLVAVRTPVTFGTLASIMKALGARDAVCLDGGGSSAMYYRGQVVCRPTRALTNIIEVHRDRVVAKTEEPVAALPARPWRTAAAQTIGRPTFVPTVHPNAPVGSGVHQEQFGVLGGLSSLRLAKGRLVFVPLDRAKLLRLKGRKNDHVSPNAAIMRHVAA